MWVSYFIPHDAMAGNYSATISFTGKANGKSFRITKDVNAKVYPVVLPEQTLWVTNWFVHDFTRINGNQPVEAYSDRWWELLTSMAHVMRDHGQNTYIFWDLAGLCNIQSVGTQYSFDFTNFDRMVKLLISEGGLKRIEGGHLSGGRLETGLGIGIPKLGLRLFENDTTQQFLSQFLPALYSHLEKNGWKDMYIQHIADEPPARLIPSYIRIAEFVKKHMPGIPIIDAIDDHGSLDFANTVNVWVPLLDKYHRNYTFFQERQAAGDEVWFYTCCKPQNNYANRFLELPLIQTRFLHWINYRYKATGYLHWGFNFWGLCQTNDVFKDASCNHRWPAGDAWIVYPAEGTVYSSIRLAAMRDGIADYELLKLLELKNPDKAEEVAGDVIKNFDAYNNNIRAFRLTRLKLLKLLSE